MLEVEAMIPRKHFDIAKQIEDRLRVAWQINPVVMGKNGRYRNAAAPASKFGPLEKCIAIAATEDGIEIRLLHQKRSEVYAVLVASVPQHLDGVRIDFADPDPTDETKLVQMHLGEAHG